MISKSKEEYLKNMYILYRQNSMIRVTDVANKMGYSKSSVNQMINNLKKEGLVDYETYGKIALTKQGEDLAKKVIETYDIVYLFLTDVLNIEKTQAKIDAEKIKLVLSDNTINSLAKYVHKVLKLDSLECCYDVNKDKCRNCKKTISRKTRYVKLKEGESYGRKFIKNK